MAGIVNMCLCISRFPSRRSIKAILYHTFVYLGDFGKSSRNKPDNLKLYTNKNNAAENSLNFDLQVAELSTTNKLHLKMQDPEQKT